MENSGKQLDKNIFFTISFNFSVDQDCLLQQQRFVLLFGIQEPGMLWEKTSIGVRYAGKEAISFITLT